MTNDLNDHTIENGSLRGFRFPFFCHRRALKGRLS